MAEDAPPAAFDRFTYRSRAGIIHTFVGDGLKGVVDFRLKFFPSEKGTPDISS
jgi:hypothetical protein